MIEIFIKLMMGHALKDFALQIDAMAKGKNRNNIPDFVPVGQKSVPCWPYWLSAHALISGGAVVVITNSILLGVMETVIHFIVDFAKCENLTDPHLDQMIHAFCRLCYAGIAFYGLK